MNKSDLLSQETTSKVGSRVNALQENQPQPQRETGADGVEGADGGRTKLADLQPARPLITATRLVHSTNRIRNAASVLLGLLVCALVAMAFLPWQQSARGTGRVVAYRPWERQQEVLSPMEGVVKRVPETLVEGALVREGELLLEIEPFAADQNMQIESQIVAKQRQREITQIQAENYRSVVSRLEDVRDRTVDAAKQAVEAARSKVQQKVELLSGYQQAEFQTGSNFKRQSDLHREGIVSTADLEKYEASWRKAAAELESAKQGVKEAEAELSGKLADLEQKREKAQSDIFKAESDVQAAESKLQSITKEISDLRQKLGSLQRGEILAPSDGFIHRLPVFAGGQSVKKGEYLLTFVPQTDEYAVELLIRGNDMPLVESGDHVRLQFEGWPAIQFSGWPDMAYGTFGGEVALVDPTDDGTGKFRIMVRPASEETWPAAARLRQGVRVNGWVMLRRVPLVYEIWRQLNGFPPLPPESMKKDAGKDAKRPKVLK